MSWLTRRFAAVDLEDHDARGAAISIRVVANRSVKILEGNESRRNNLPINWGSGSEATLRLGGEFAKL